MPACSVYLETDHGRFGPFSVDVELDADWRIVGHLYWKSPVRRGLRIKQLVVLSPIGTAFFPGDTYVEPGGCAVGDITVTNQLPSNPSLLDQYLKDEITIEEFEDGLDTDEL